MVSECDLDLWLKVGSQPPLPGTTHSWERQSIASSAVRSTAQPSSEPELVKDCLHALQGLPAAVKRLENQSVAYCLQPADKTIHNISTLWTLSSSTSALAKLLHQLALAGSHRCQLDQFVEFFTGPRNTGCQRRPRKKKERPSCGDDRSTDSSPGLLNQAFAAAVRTILQGYSASLDSLLDSLSRRRISDSRQPFGGALFGYGHGLMSLLELFLHTQELRLQLQALTRVCLINTADSETELLSYNMDIFRAFPKGADLLTHLYNLLLEPDPVHVELLRFLFARTCEPYEVFIRSCIYSATLTDPYGEFILEQTSSPHSTGQPLRSTLKVRDGVNAPIFLVQVCAQLLLAGQQLEVLLKHPQTREFAKSFDSFGQEVVEEHLPEDKETEEERIEESVEVSEANIEDTKSGSCDLLQSNFNGDEEYSVNFFLSGYNRGASWLDVGLPKNPFFDGNHLTVYGYVTTLFMEGYDGWDIRSDVLNEDSLMRKLVPELAQVGLLSLKSFKKIDSVDPIRVLLDDNNLPLISVKSCQQEGVHVDHQENDDIFSIQEEKPANREPAPGGGSWVTMLRQTRLQNICNPAEKLKGCEDVASADKTQEEFRKDYQEDASLDVPISVVVEKSIVNEILTQYRLVSGYTVRLLQVNLHLQEHYVALKRYYFMEVGDWAENFITALCSHKWKVSAGKHQLLEVQRMLEAALQKSSCDGDSHAERLYICKDFECHDFINRNSLQAFDFIELGYHVEWPLDLVLTAESFRLYKLIFRQLLRIKHVVFALGEINSSLQVMERSLRKCTLSSSQQKDRFRTLQLFRHQIGHFITALQCYVQSQLLHVIWGDFVHGIQHEIKDMQDIEVVHIKYLNNAVRQCFLSWDVEEVKHCIENIMQCMLDFRASLKNIQVMDETDVCSNHLYSKVLELRSLFLDNISCLHKYYVKHQVSDFWTALDYNGYFASVC